MSIPCEIYEGYNQDSDLLDPNGQFKKIYLEKFISVFPGLYLYGWLFLASAYFFVLCFSFLFLENSLLDVGIPLILAAIIALEGITICWSRGQIKCLKPVLINIINLPREIIIESFDKLEEEIFNDKKLIAFSATFLIFVHLTGIDYHSISFNTFFSLFIFNLGYYFAVFLLGTGLCIMIMTGWDIHRIGKMPIKINTLFSDFHLIGLIYSRFTILAACVYVMWGFFHMLVPPLFSSAQLMIWFSGFAILLIAYFILPQYSLHKMMSQTKKEKIDRFSLRLKAILDESSGDPTKENLSYLNEMFHVQTQLNQISEWPFDVYDIMKIMSIIGIPLVILTIEITFGIV